MKTKRITAILLSTVISVSLLAGCGSNAAKDSKDAAASSTGGQTTQAAKQEIKTLTVYCGDTNMKPIDVSQTPVGKKIEELTGVRLQIEYIVGNDEKTKAGVMIASGEYPDLIIPHSEFQTFVDAKAIIPVEDYIEKLGVNIKKAYGNQIKMLKNVKDGHTYSLTPFREGLDPKYSGAGFWLPVALLKDAGWPKVTSFDQYINLIKDYVKKNPTYNGKPTIGFTSLTDSWRLFTLQNAPSYLMGNANDGGIYVDQKTYEAHSFALDDSSKKYYAKINELWNEGLVDKEMFSQNYDQYLAKIASGRVIGFYDQRWQFNDAIKNLEQQKLFDRVPIAMPVLYDGVKEDSYNGPLVMGTGSGVCISKNCKDPEFAFKFLERMCAEDIQKLTNWGIQGQDYEVKDGKMYKTDEQVAKGNDPEYLAKEGIGNTFWEFPHSAPAQMYSDGSGTIDFGQSQQAIESTYKDYEKEVLKAYNIKSFAELFRKAWKCPYGYGWDIQIPDGNPIKETDQKAGDLQKKYLPKLVMAKPGTYESVWKEYETEMKKLDLAAGDAFRTKEIQRRVKEWN